MNCTPNSLMQEARCFRCIPQGNTSGVITYLMCQWANKSTNGISWTPSTELVAWHDLSGFHFGDLPFFLANADLPSVDSLDFAIIPSFITSLTGMSLLPNLQAVTVDGSPLTILDLTGCTLIADISYIGCPNLVTVLAPDSPAMNNINGYNCPNLVLLDITAAMTGNTFYTSLNPSMTTITSPNLTALVGDWSNNFNTIQTTISLPSLSSVGGAYYSNDCPALNSVNISAIFTIGTNILFSNCTSLVSLNTPILAAIGGDTLFDGCTAFTSWTFPVGMAWNDPITINFRGDALNVAAVDAILNNALFDTLSSSTILLDLGTNAPPTNDCNPGSPCDILGLLGCTVVTN